MTRRPAFRRTFRRTFRKSGRKYPNTVARYNSLRSRRIVRNSVFQHFPMYIPRVMRWIATYTRDWFTPENAAGSFRSQAYRLNSIRDPQWTTEAGQKSVNGFTVMSAIYQMYRVYKTQVQWKVMLSESNNWNEDDVKTGWIAAMEVGTEAASSAVQGSWVTNSMITSAGAARGFFTPGTGALNFYSAQEAMNRNGVLFPGSIAYKNVRHITWPNGQLRGRGMTTIRRTFNMWNLSESAVSFAQWKALASWNATMTTDPANTRIVGVGITPQFGNNTPAASVAAFDNFLKMKMHTLLSSPLRPVLTLAPAEVVPLTAAGDVEAAEEGEWAGEVPV